MKRTWEDNATEFGALTKQGVDVRLAVLVACSVELGKGSGIDSRSEGLSDATASLNEKVSAGEFARTAGTHTDRISRHLKAWNKCAADGLCTPSSDLTPGDAANPDLVVPTVDDFKARFDASNAGARPRASRGEIVDAIVAKDGYAAKLVEAMPSEAKAEIAEALVADEGARVAIGLAHIDRDKKLYGPTRKAKEAEGDARRERLKDHGEQSILGNGPLQMAEAEIDSWLTHVEKVSYRLTTDAAENAREYGEAIRDKAALVIEIANGEISATFTDADAEALLEGGK